MIHRIWIPACFASDHTDRDLPTGKFIETHPRKGWLFECSDDELAEWRSDASYYSDCAGQGWDMGPDAVGLQSSAQATVKRIDKHLSKYDVAGLNKLAAEITKAINA